MNDIIARCAMIDRGAASSRTTGTAQSHRSQYVGRNRARCCNDGGCYGRRSLGYEAAQGWPLHYAGDNGRRSGGRSR